MVRASNQGADAGTAAQADRRRLLKERSCCGACASAAHCKAAWSSKLEEATGNYKIVVGLSNMEQGDCERFLNGLCEHGREVPFKGVPMIRLTSSIFALVACLAVPAWAQTPGTVAVPQQPATTSPTASVAPVGVTPPADYVIGADDQLTIIFWREKDMSADVSVRPDGKISLPLLNDMQASGLTPEQLRMSLTEAAGKFIEEPTVTVVVKAINSRRVFITGQVDKPGPYPLTAPTTVLQLLALAGGVTDYAKSEQIQVMRTENGKTTNSRFNYKDVTKGKNLEQNIMLKPGDTVIVP